MPGGGNVWDRMSEDDRNDTIANKVKSGELEIVYARPGPNGLYYVTVRPPKDGIYDGNVIIEGKIVGAQG